jgi:hypothetical protein
LKSAVYRDTSQKVGIWHFWYSFSKNAKFSDSDLIAKIGIAKIGITILAIHPDRDPDLVIPILAIVTPI